MNTLFDNIKKLAEDNNLTIKDIEKATGLTNGQIGKWKTSKPNIYKVQLVAQYFGVSIDSLLSKEESSNCEDDQTIIDLKSIEGFMKLNMKQRELLKKELYEYLSYRIYKILK